MKFLALTAVVIGLISSGCNSVEKDVNEENGSAPVRTYSSESPVRGDAALSSNENLFSNLQHLPVELIEEAMAKFQSRNYADAASSLETSAELLRTQQKSMINQTAASELRTASTLVDQVADQVRNGKLRSNAQLGTLLATALYHDANAHRYEAQLAWTKGSSKQTGFHMEAATDSLGRSQKIADRKGVWLKTDVSSARETATTLMKGSGWKKENVARSLEIVNAGVDELKKELSVITTKSSTTNSSGLAR